MKKSIKKTTEKYVTEKTFNNFETRFDASMRAVAKSFADNAEIMALIELYTKIINIFGKVLLA